MRASELLLARCGLAAVVLVSAVGCAQTETTTRGIYSTEREALTRYEVAGDPAAIGSPVIRLAAAKERELIESASAGDAERVRRLLGEGARADMVDEWGRSALLSAARAGDLEVARVLLRAGADVNGRGGDMTPLGAAAVRGHLHMVRLLLSAGARVDAVGIAGETPLMGAVRMNHLDVAAALLGAGANARVRDRLGSTLLVIAILGNSPRMVELLLHHGADPNVLDDDGRTALDRAVQFGLEDVAQRLRGAGAVNGWRADDPRSLRKRTESGAG